MTSSPVASLGERHGVPTLDEASVDNFLRSLRGSAEGALLFFTGNPAERVEARDVAVVLPELIAVFEGRLRAALIARSAEEALRARFKVTILPSLALVIGGESRAVFPRICDWSDYVAGIEKALLDAPVSTAGVETSKARFWVALEGAEAEITVLSIGNGAEALAMRAAPSRLGTADSAELVRRCAATARLLPEIAEALETQREGEPGRLFDVTDFLPDDLELVAQILGEGEVTGVVALPDGVTAQIQEAVMAGLWRVRFSNARHEAIADYIEVAAIPAVVPRGASSAAPQISLGAPPPGAMNVMPVLAEIADHIASHRSGQPPHIINFSLFPMSPIDMQFLQETLQDGPVQLISRGYGQCRITATGALHVWSVQYFNSMDTIILDTLEIGDTPAVACAAESDFRDSALRLREIEEAYFK